MPAAAGDRPARAEHCANPHPQPEEPDITRTLVLKREHLTELTHAELAVVAGAALPTEDLGRCLDSQFPGSILPCIDLTGTCTRPCI